MPTRKESRPKHSCPQGKSALCVQGVDWTSDHCHCAREPKTIQHLHRQWSSWRRGATEEHEFRHRRVNVTGCCIAIVAKGIAMISTDSSAAIGISTRRGVGNVRKRMKPMRSQDQVALRILGRNTWDTTICSECCGNAQILAVGAHFEIISFGMEAYVLAWYGVLCHVVTWILQPATREKMRKTLRHLSMLAWRCGATRFREEKRHVSLKLGRESKDCLGNVCSETVLRGNINGRSFG